MIGYIMWISFSAFGVLMGFITLSLYTQGQITGNHWHDVLSFVSLWLGVISFRLTTIIAARL